MKILKMLSQNRRDFYADFICENCQYVEMGVSGYDDSYFHSVVIPEMACKKCGEKAPKDFKPESPKYSDETVI